MSTIFHYWVGNITGYVFSTENKCPILKPTERMKYLGYTESMGWPKKMNTGRLLKKPHGSKGEKRQIRRQRKLRKKS